jgi:glutamate dehydrogenase (NADP+)
MPPGACGQKTWRNKPLFRREGDARFRTGAEAAQMLINEVKRRDAHESQFVQTFENAIQTLAPVFDRMPKYAFVAKEFLEPERIIQFRVSWLDDSGSYRMNRGFRVQVGVACRLHSAA